MGAYVVTISSIGIIIVIMLILTAIAVANRHTDDE